MAGEGAATWLQCCRAFGEREGVAHALLEVLAAFRSPDPRGGPPPPPEAVFEGSFEQLEARVLARDPFAEVEGALSGEVDGEQARMFGRRLASVDGALARGGDASSRVLRVGLRVRLAGMLDSSRAGARALRMRALADFYYSQLGRHLHLRRAGGGPSLARLVEGLSWRSVVPGLSYAQLRGPSAQGPVHINLLRAEPERVRVEAHDCRGALEQGQDFLAQAAQLGAAAAVSGGFFLYSEPDIEAPSARFDPVGLLLSRGQLLSPPVFRRGAVLVDEQGRIEIGALGPEALEIELGGARLSGASMVTRAQARRGPDRASVAVVGREVVACGESLAVPLNGFVLPLPPGLARAVRLGDQLRYGPLIGAGGTRLRCAVAGGPLLRVDDQPRLDMRGEDFWGTAPPVTFSQDETGDRNLLPRLAAGRDPQGALLLAAVDGRDFERALGMSLGELGELMGLLGCVDVTNLDGGSSKRMLVEGRLVDLASTEIQTQGEREQQRARVRPVHTGLFLLPR